MEIGPKGDVTGGSRFFEKSPFRSTFFFVDTIILNLSILAGLIVMVRNHDRLPITRTLSVCLVLVGMVLLWNASLRAHRRINELYQAGAIEKVLPGSPLESAIRVAAGMLHLGLAYTFGLCLILLAQLGELFAHR